MSRAIVQQLIKLHQAQTRNIDHHCAKLLPAKEMRWLHLTPAQSSCEYFCKIVEAGIRIQSRTFFSNHKPNRSIPMTALVETHHMLVLEDADVYAPKYTAL